MSWLHQALDVVRHFDTYLASAADHLGWKLFPLLFAIIFCETGLVVTPFLPGDSLLFVLGALVAKGTLSFPLVAVVICVAANCGDLVNYTLGYKLGPKVFTRESSWLLNKKHLTEAQNFYEKYGAMTIILARFVPFIRTFAPFVAGIGKMRFARFAAFSISGGIFWVVTVLSAGYFFGNMPVVKNNFELVVIAIVVISVLPAVIHWFKARNSRGFEVVAPAANEKA